MKRYQLLFAILIFGLVGFQSEKNESISIEKITRVKSQSIKSLEKSEEINSLKDAVAQFKGRKVYIDIWATFCKPCVKEFEYHQELMKLLKKKNVEMVYISLDGKEQKKLMEEIITKHNLEGKHIIANDSLRAELLLKVFSQGLSIPKYLIIDENGNLINNDAKRPSQINELEKQFENK